MSAKIFACYSNLMASKDPDDFVKKFELFKNELEEIPDKIRNANIKAFLVELNRIANNNDVVYGISIEHRAQLFQIIQYLDMVVQEFQKTIPPIQWLGSIADWGAIMEAIVEGGYIEHARNSNGVVYNKLASCLMPHFSFDNKSYQANYLADQLNPSRRNKSAAEKFRSPALKIPQLERK